MKSLQAGTRLPSKLGILAPKLWRAIPFTASKPLGHSQSSTSLRHKPYRSRSRLLPRGAPTATFITASSYQNAQLVCPYALRRSIGRTKDSRHQSHPSYTNTHIHQHSSIGGPLSALAVLIVAGIVTYLDYTALLGAFNSNRDAVPNILIGGMSDPPAPGHVGNLTLEQEEKLRKLWQSVFQLCGVGDDNNSISNSLTAHEGPTSEEPDGQKKKRFGIFRRKGNDKSGTVESAEDDKYGQNKQFHETLANQSPESIHETIWSMVKHDHPDALLLRFLRARKWDVEKALVMFVSTMSWRHNEMKVDPDIMKNGEEGAVFDEKSGSVDAKRIGHDFMAQIRMGKSFLHGVDRQGRPICVVRVRLHKQGEQCEESLERYTVFLIETARMVLAPPIDTATIVFDMTGFSMANMDYTPVKFMIKCFEANYPESLGAVLVHNAPWIFQGIWKIIRGWLDPVVAAKVHFTNNKSELEEFIEPGRIIKELGGDEHWEYEYVEPIVGENDLMKDTETKGRLINNRKSLVREFENATLRWIHESDGEVIKKVKVQRSDLATNLKDDYWRLDPYLRARSLYDREGILKQGGEINWYAKPISNGIAKETTTEDVE